MTNSHMEKAKRKTGGMIRAGLMASGIALVLAGCGASPKQQFSKGHEDISKADTLEMNTNVSVKAEGKELDPEMVSLLNSVSLKANIKSDLKTKQHEVDAAASAKLGAMALKLKLPLFIDETNEKVYTKSESYMELMNTAMTAMSPMPMLSVETPAKLKGKVVELSAADAGVKTTEKEKKQQEKAAEDFNKKLTAYLKDASEKSFKQDGDNITFTADGQKVLDLLLDTLEQNPELMGESDISTDIANLRKNIKKNVQVGDVDIHSTMDGKKVSSDDITIPMTVVDQGEKVKVTLHMVNTYKSINEKLNFTFNLDKKNIVKQDEFDDVMRKALLESDK